MANSESRDLTIASELIKILDQEKEIKENVLLDINIDYQSL